MWTKQDTIGILTIIAMALVFILAGTAQAQAAHPGGIPYAASVKVWCASRQYMVEYLTTSFGEAPTDIAITPGGDVLEIWQNRNPKQGNDPSWTMVFTFKDGDTCLSASGSEWERRPYDGLKIDPSNFVPAYGRGDG